MKTARYPERARKARAADLPSSPLMRCAGLRTWAEGAALYRRPAQRCALSSEYTDANPGNKLASAVIFTPSIDNSGSVIRESARLLAIAGPQLFKSYKPHRLGCHSQEIDDIGFALERSGIGLNEAVIDRNFADPLELVFADADVSQTRR